MTPRPSDVSKWFLFACLAVSALYTGVFLRDYDAMEKLAMTAAGVLGLAGFTTLSQGQKAIDAKVDDLHQTVNSAMTAKDARTDALTVAATGAAKLSSDTDRDAAKLASDTATDVAKLSADSEASTAAGTIAALLARIAELERRPGEKRGP